jgi:hypothetical protein
VNYRVDISEKLKNLYKVVMREIEEHERR